MEDWAPIILRETRAKSLLPLLLFSILTAAGALTLLGSTDRWQGALWLVVWCPAMAFTLARLLSPAQLRIDLDGVSTVYPWTTKTWRWTEVRGVRRWRNLIVFDLVDGRRKMSNAFMGVAGIHTSWGIDADRLVDLLNSARE